VYIIANREILVNRLFGCEIQSVSNVQTQPVSEVAVAKAPAVLSHQTIRYLELSAVDCLLNTFNRCFNLHINSFAVLLNVL